MSSVLREDLLAGVSALVAGPTGEATTASLSRLGARITAFAPGLDDAGEGGAAWVGERLPFDALVFDASGWVPPAGASAGSGPLQALLDEAWIATAAAANGAFIPEQRPGRIVLIAPAHRSRPGAPAAAAGLENLARTLSIEWARHRITASAVSPGPDTKPATLATLVAYLLSPAGAYFSGGRLELDALAS